MEVSGVIEVPGFPPSPQGLRRGKQVSGFEDWLNVQSLVGRNQLRQNGYSCKVRISIFSPSILSKCLMLRVATENPRERAVEPMMRSWAPI